MSLSESITEAIENSKRYRTYENINYPDIDIHASLSKTATWINIICENASNNHYGIQLHIIETYNWGS